MSLNIWTQCEGKFKFKNFDLIVWRAIENQNQIATRKLVDSIEEQLLLEELIEGVKPRAPQDAEWRSLHYLLSTPFRYPPLKHGSRFGSRDERGIWYGSLEEKTALCETAFLRLRLLNDTTADIRSELSYTLFNIPVKSSKSLDLTQAPFEKFKDDISNKQSYGASQLLGRAMRNEKAEIFKYFSARTRDIGFNIGIFSPKVFLRKTPLESSFQRWYVYATKEQVDFISGSFSTSLSYSFKKNEFLINKKFPKPN